MGLFKKKEKNVYVYEVFFTDGSVTTYGHLWVMGQGILKAWNGDDENDNAVFLPPHAWEKIKTIQVAGYAKIGRKGGK